MRVLNPAMEFDYNARVRELFADLRHAHVLPDVSVSASAGAREQGSYVTLFMQIQDRRVRSASYQAYGCPHFLAACELLARWLQGRALTELSQWPWRDVENELAIPANKRARLLVLDDVLQAARRRLGLHPSLH